VFDEEMGRPSIPPGVYFRMLLVGYFEGVASERGIAWRCADSLSLREFLGYELTETTPDHSTLSGLRRKLGLPLHRAVFDWVLDVAAREGILKGRRVAVDSTMLQANASMKTIVRRCDGVSYRKYLEKLTKAEGIEEPTKEDLQRLDRGRKAGSTLARQGAVTSKPLWTSLSGTFKPRRLRFRTSGAGRHLRTRSLSESASSTAEWARIRDLSAAYTS
jgi:transposase